MHNSSIWLWLPSQKKKILALCNFNLQILYVDIRIETKGKNEEDEGGKRKGTVIQFEV